MKTIDGKHFRDLLLEHRNREEWNAYYLDNGPFDVHRVDLSGLDLSGRNLSKSRFDGVVARQTILSGADLSHIYMPKGDLEGAIFEDAKLSFAYLRG